jgi:hypothetical protein
MQELLIEKTYLEQIRALKKSNLNKNFSVALTEYGGLLLKCFHTLEEIKDKAFFANCQNEVKETFNRAGITDNLLSDFYSKFGKNAYKNFIVLKIKLYPAGRTDLRISELYGIYDPHERETPIRAIPQTYKKKRT